MRLQGQWPLPEVLEAPGGGGGGGRNNPLQGVNGVGFGENKPCKVPVPWGGEEKPGLEGSKVSLCQTSTVLGGKRPFLRWHFLGMEALVQQLHPESWMELNSPCSRV